VVGATFSECFPVNCSKDIYAHHCVAEDRQMSRNPDVSDVESQPIVCPATELCLYSGTRLATIIRQLKTQLSREDPGEEFKVSIR